MHTPSTPALWRRRQVGLYEFKGNLVYIESFRISGATRQDHKKMTKMGKT